MNLPLIQHCCLLTPKYNLFISGGMQLTSVDDLVCPLECISLSHQDYMDLLWTSISEIPGLLLTAGLIDLIGRRWTMRLLFGLFMVTCGILFICMSQ